jgi:hypothetical protein
VDDHKEGATPQGLPVRIQALDVGRCLFGWQRS